MGNCSLRGRLESHDDTDKAMMMVSMMIMIMVMLAMIKMVMMMVMAFLPEMMMMVVMMIPENLHCHRESRGGCHLLKSH